MSRSNAQIQDLTVKGESIERIYSHYSEQRFLVNRRYQRKLIWTLEEKNSFIDSIIRGYPVPIILLAENKILESNFFEIIDGMQRLNAIISFIENDFAVTGYFDLNTMAVTKAKLDSGQLQQKTPILPREQCVTVASYLIPLSIYEFSNKDSVDEIFRRINSGGRKLSRQELRTAGATGHFAQVVRKISAKVRGDDSSTDIIMLNLMKNISITNKELDYGISVESIFWVKEGILTKDLVRQSRDEEIVADIIAYMVSEKAISSRTEFLDDFYGMGDDEPSSARYIEIETSVQKRTQDLVIADFQRTYNELQLVLAHSTKTFGQLLFQDRPAKAPRYFQAVFLAFYVLLIRQNMEIRNRTELVNKMLNSGANITIQEGGKWGAEERERAINQAIGLYQGAFQKATARANPAEVHWISQLENILMQSYTEQNAYDFKQGFLRLDESKAFDDDSFTKILITCSAIANIRRGAKGYVLVGIADNTSTASRVNTIFGIEPKSYENFYITGIDHEAKALGKNLDQLFQYIIERIKSSPLSPNLKDYLARNLKSVRYYDKTVFVFEIESQDDPSSYADIFYTRHGANVTKITTPELPHFFRRYFKS